MGKRCNVSGGNSRNALMKRKYRDFAARACMKACSFGASPGPISRIRISLPSRSHARTGYNDQTRAAWPSEAFNRSPPSLLRAEGKDPPGHGEPPDAGNVPGSGAVKRLR